MFSGPLRWNDVRAEHTWSTVIVPTYQYRRCIINFFVNEWFIHLLFCIILDFCYFFQKMSIFQYSPDGSRVAATSADGRLSIWNKNSGKPTFLESLMKIVLCKNVCFCLCCSKFYVKESFCFTYFNAINEKKYTNQRTKNCRFCIHTKFFRIFA